MEDGFVVRFRGVRGSYPVPGSDTLKYGGNTSCVEVWAGGRLIILDAGTGIIGLGNMYCPVAPRKRCRNRSRYGLSSGLAIV